MALQKKSNASWVFWAIPPLVAIAVIALFVIAKAYFAFSHQQHSAPTISPHPAATIHLTGAPYLTLVIGDRFEATFENGFVINSATDIEALPEEWVRHLDTYGRANTRVVKAYYYIKTKDLDPVFSFGTDENNKVLSVRLGLHRPNVTIKDLKTGKTQKLYDSPGTLDEVVAYFKSLPE
ncbi:MAG: hypothetical protein ACO1RA_05665 [Planctomycetaceae bacterium]